MTLNQLPRITLDDIQKRPLVVTIAILICFSGWLLIGDRNKYNDCEEKLKAKDEFIMNVTSQMLVQRQVIERQRDDSAKVKTDQINEKIKDIIK